MLPGRVEHHIEQLICLRDGFEAEPLGHGPSRRTRVEHGHVPAGDLGELGRGEADGARADDEYRLPELYPGPFHGVLADTQGFDERELIACERVRFEELVHGQGEAFAHAAVGVHAEADQCLATIRSTRPAGRAGAAGEVRFDGAAVADFQSVVARRERFDFDGEFVAEDAGVGEERLPAREGVKVRAADANAEYADERVARRDDGVGHVRRDEVPGLAEADLEHEGFALRFSRSQTEFGTEGKSVTPPALPWARCSIPS